MYRDYDDRAPDGDRILREIRREQRREEIYRRRQREIKQKKMIIAAVLLLVVIAAAVLFITKNVFNKTESAADEIKETIKETDYTKSEIVEQAVKETDYGEPESMGVLTEESVPADLMEGGTAEEADTVGISGDVPYADGENPVLDYVPKNAGELSFSDDGAGYMGSDEVTSTYSILANVSERKIAAVKNAYDKIYPASMTKILTLLVACENIDNLDDEFEITIEDTDYAYSNDCSAVGFSLGEMVKVKDMLYGTILPSGGDAAHALARYVAGSHEAFVDMMNERLVSLGISDNTHFTNCVGIYDDNHYTTCCSMAVILEAAMDNPVAREVLSAHRYTTSSTAEHPDGIEISNLFLRRIEDKDTSGEVIGAKTGFVVQSRNCAASFYKSDAGVDYICVTADAHSAWRAIYDHVAVYNIYAAGNAGYKKME